MRRIWFWKIIIEAVISAVIATVVGLIVAYLAFRWQLSSDLRKITSQLSYQGKLEGLKIERERIARKNRIEELSEKSRLLSRRLSEDLVLAQDTIYKMHQNSLDSIRRDEIRRGNVSGVPSSITYDRIIKDRLKNQRDERIKRWVSLRKREIEDISLEIKLLTQLNKADNIPIPSPVLEDST